VKKNVKQKIFLTLVMIYLFIPVVATILFSLATKWDSTVLPEGYTLKCYATLFSDQRFIMSLLRTINVSIITAVVSVVILVPCIYMTVVYYKRLEKLFELFSIIPFVLPGVILAVGLIQLYSNAFINITGTVWILLGSYFILCLPYMYQTIRNSFRAIDALKLTEAALILGCNEFQAFFKVVLPNVLKGIISAVLLTISILFGEFVLVNLLVGGNYETVQMYLFKTLYADGHLASAVVTVYLMIVLILSYITIKLTGKKKETVKETEA
jgi:putative spermidine/putrescine transport system permease protein